MQSKAASIHGQEETEKKQQWNDYAIRDSLSWRISWQYDGNRKKKQAFNDDSTRESR